MIQNTPISPIISERKREESRLWSEANRKFAPARPGTLYEGTRKLLIQEHVKSGLAEFDANQRPEEPAVEEEEREELMIFAMDL